MQCLEVYKILSDWGGAQFLIKLICSTGRIVRVGMTQTKNLGGTCPRCPQFLHLVGLSHQVWSGQVYNARVSMLQLGHATPEKVWNLEAITLFLRLFWDTEARDTHIIREFLWE